MLSTVILCVFLATAVYTEREWRPLPLELYGVVSGFLISVRHESAGVSLSHWGHFFFLRGGIYYGDLSV